MKLEIERKFILKSIPYIDSTEVIRIDQFYRKNGDIWERARLCESNVNGISYVHTIKKSVSKSINIEDEKLLTEAQYNEFVSLCKKDEEYRFIKKSRHIFPYKNLKWEVDVFDDKCHIIIAEIEIPRKNYDLVIPKFIKDVMLLEVTGLKQFSNRSLSEKIKNTKKWNIGCMD